MKRIGGLTVVLMLLALTAQAATAADVQTIDLTSGSAGKGGFTALLFKPAGSGPFPAVVAMHGCAGLLTAKGEVQARERDWAERLVAAGFAVLLTDSFTARGYRQICTTKDRPIEPEDRAHDAAAAAQWLGRQSWADANRLALMGWSHGAMSVLWTVRRGFMTRGPRFRTAIAFYPGCRDVLQLDDWKPAVPLTFLLGALDDWTRPGPCKELAARGGAKVIEYAGAYHAFDTPNLPVRVRKGLPSVKSGEAHVGTNPEARAAAILEVGRILSTALGPAAR